MQKNSQNITNAYLKGANLEKFSKINWVRETFLVEFSCPFMCTTQRLGGTKLNIFKQNLKKISLFRAVLNCSQMKFEAIIVNLCNNFATFLLNCFSAFVLEHSLT